MANTLIQRSGGNNSLDKLIEPDRGFLPYLEALMVAALNKTGGTLAIPAGLQLWYIYMKTFNFMIVEQARKIYDYGIISL